MVETNKERLASTLSKRVPFTVPPELLCICGDPWSEHFRPRGRGRYWWCSKCMCTNFQESKLK